MERGLLNLPQPRIRLLSHHFLPPAELQTRQARQTSFQDPLDFLLIDLLTAVLRLRLARLCQTLT
jgi:hypothetical protein